MPVPPVLVDMLVEQCWERGCHTVMLMSPVLNALARVSLQYLPGSTCALPCFAACNALLLMGGTPHSPMHNRGVAAIVHQKEKGQYRPQSATPGQYGHSDGQLHDIYRSPHWTCSALLCHMNQALTSPLVSGRVDPVRQYDHVSVSSVSGRYTHSRSGLGK